MHFDCRLITGAALAIIRARLPSPAEAGFAKAGPRLLFMSLSGFHPSSPVVYVPVRISSVLASWRVYAVARLGARGFVALAFFLTSFLAANFAFSLR